MADATTTVEKPELPAVPAPNATEIPPPPPKKSFAQFVQSAEKDAPVPAKEREESKARVEPKEKPVEKAPEKTPEKEREEPEAKKEPVAEKSNRSAMREATAKAEEKARAKQEAAKTEAEKEPAKEEPAKQEPVKPKRFADDFIEPTDPKAVRTRINDLGARIENEIKTREKVAAEADDLRKQLAELTKRSSELPPDVRERLDRAQMLQRRLDIESDPEIKAKFDDRIAAAESTVTGILKGSLGLNEGSIAVIEKAGGLAAFAKSKGQFNWKAADGTTETVSAAELYTRWLGELPASDADVIRGMMAEQARTKTERDRAITEGSAKAKEFFETEAKTRAEQVKQAQQAQKQVVETISKTIDSSLAGADWLKDAEVPDNDPEAAAEIKEENEIRALARKTAKEAVSMSDPRDIAELVLDSVRVHYVERKLRVAEARIAELESETTRLKSGSRTIPRNGSGRGADGAAPAKPERNPGESSFAYNTRMAMAAAEARGS